MPRHWRDLAALAARGLVAVLPFVAWFFYVRSVFPPVGASDAANFASPFSGYLSKWEFTIAQLQSSGWWGSWARFNLAALVSLTVQAGFLLARREWGSPWWRAGAAYCALLPFLSYPVWEGDPGAIMRVVLPMSVAFNILVVRSRWFWPLVDRGQPHGPPRHAHAQRALARDDVVAWRRGSPPVPATGRALRSRFEGHARLLAPDRSLRATCRGACPPSPESLVTS